MKQKLLFTLLVGCLTAVSTGHAAPDMTAPEAMEAASTGKIILIDIRTPDEWRQTGVAKGAARVNLYHPQGAKGFYDQLLAQVGGDMNAPIGLICRTGNRTTQAQKFLQGQGFKNVYNVNEGMAGSAAGPGWLKRGLPVESCGQC